MTSVGLWLGGAILLAIGIWRGRPPYLRMKELDRLAENSRRYESWRGGRSGPENETTGADVMRDMLRRQVSFWAGIVVLGIVLIVAGFVIR